MTNNELYWLIFFDSLFSNFLFTLGSEYVIDVMSSFDLVNKNNILILYSISVLGYIAGVSLNYPLGWVLYYIPDLNNYTQSKRVSLTKDFLNQKTAFILMVFFASLPYVSILLMVFLGLLRINIVKSFFIIAFSALIKYYYILYYSNNYIL